MGNINNESNPNKVLNAVDNNTKNPNVPNLRFNEFEGKWCEKYIGDILTICHGKDYQNLKYGNYPVLGTGGIITYVDSFLCDWPCVAIGRKGTINKPQYLDFPFWSVDTLFYSKPKNNENPEFQYNLFQTINWDKYNEASGVPSLSASTIERIKVFIPNYNEQSKISKFLRLVDTRIVSQNKIISDLEFQKKGLFDKLIKQNKSFWQTVKLSSILHERKAYATKDNSYPHATLSKEGISAKTDRYDRDFLVKDEEKEYKITHLNDICYNPANLKFGVICRNTFGSAIFSPIYVTYEVSSGYNPCFIELILTNKNFLNYIRKYEQGTVYERMAVNSEDFLKGEIAIPSLEEQNKITKIFTIIDDKIQIEKDTLELYKQQKTYLLRNLFI